MAGCRNAVRPGEVSNGLPVRFRTGHGNDRGAPNGTRRRGRPGAGQQHDHSTDRQHRPNDATPVAQTITTRLQEARDVKFRVDRDALAESVAWAARSLPTRPSVPVLAGLLLDATSPDDQAGLRLSGFD